MLKFTEKKGGLAAKILTAVKKNADFSGTQPMLTLRQWGTSAKKKNKKLLKNKPSHDEPSLPRCNTPSMAGLFYCHVSRTKQQKNHAQHNHDRKVHIALHMNYVYAAIFLASSDPAIDEILHRGRQDSSRLGLFWGIFFLFFIFGQSPSFKCILLTK